MNKNNIILTYVLVTLIFITQSYAYDWEQQVAHSSGTTIVSPKGQSFQLDIISSDYSSRSLLVSVNGEQKRLGQGESYQFGDLMLTLFAWGGNAADSASLFAANFISSTPNCQPQSYKACYNGDVYWYDSCNSINGRAMDCFRAGCNNGQCNPHCNDGICSSNENCQTCPNDCGTCSCSYPIQTNCDTQTKFNQIIQEYNQGKCTMEQLNLCRNAYINNLNKCPYPSQIDCDTKEEVDIIAANWVNNQGCTRAQSVQCAQNWVDIESVKNQCSYPSKVSCTTQSDVDKIIAEWKQGTCSIQIMSECNDKFNSLNQPKCTAGWKCSPENNRYYEDSNCQCSSVGYCPNGCYNGECIINDVRKECSGNMAIVWYNSVGQETRREWCNTQGKFCQNGQCVLPNNPSCKSSWSCGSWSSCSNGQQTRTCTDTKCGQGSKTETQNCNSPTQPPTYQFSDYPLILIHGYGAGYDASNPMINLKSRLSDFYEFIGIFDNNPYNLNFKELKCNEIKKFEKTPLFIYTYTESLIKENAKDFASFIKKLQECTNTKKVDIIAHSQGGVISRWAIKFNNSQVDKLIMLGTPNNNSKDLLVAFVILSFEEYKKLNNPAPSCCGVNYYTIGGITGNTTYKEPWDGVIIAKDVVLNGAVWNKEVRGCSHSKLIQPSECPQAYRYILEALGKSTTQTNAITGNVVQNTVAQQQTTDSSLGGYREERYCCSWFLWCWEYCVRYIK